MKYLLSLLLLASSSLSFGQYTMAYDRIDSSNACSGTLADMGGPDGDYLTGADAVFYINPPGTAITLDFSQLKLASGSGIMVYKGYGTYGTREFAYTTYSSTSPRTVHTSEGITILFYTSNYQTDSGFVMNWSTTGGPSTASSNMTASNLSPALNQEVEFEALTLGLGYNWDFGDGSSSSKRKPSHAYSAPGTYTVTLTASSCSGATSTSTQTITVDSAPSVHLSSDSIYVQINCGDSISPSIWINNSGSGALLLEAHSLTNPQYLFNSDFNGTLGGLSVSPQASNGFSIASTHGSAIGDSSFLSVIDNTPYYRAAEIVFPPTQPSELSYWVKGEPTTSVSGVVNLYGDDFFNNGSTILKANAVNRRLQVQTGSGFEIYTIFPNVWNHVRFTNFNYVSKTFDVYVNGVLKGVSLSFLSSIPTTVNRFSLSNAGGSDSKFDNVKLLGKAPVEQLLLSLGNSSISSDSTQLVIQKDFSQLPAGRYTYNIQIRTNLLNADSIITLPVVVDLVGSPLIDLAQSCLDFDSVSTGYPYQLPFDVINFGCDSLVIDSITWSTGVLNLSTVPSIIEPFDTAHLTVTLLPNNPGLLLDTFHIYNNNVDTIVCVSALALAQATALLDTNVLNVQATNCPDTLHSSFVIFNEGDVPLTWDTRSQGTFRDNFDDSDSASSVWEDIGTCIIGAHCNSLSGNSMLLDGAQNVARSAPFYSSGNDSVHFWVSVPLALTGCTPTNTGSNTLRVEYCPVGSTNWTVFGAFFPYTTTPTVSRSYPLPYRGMCRVRFTVTNYIAGVTRFFIDDVYYTGKEREVSTNPVRGVIPAMDSAIVDFKIYTDTLRTGTYTYKLDLNSDDAMRRAQEITINLNVVGQPEFAFLDTNYINYDTLIRGNVRVDTIHFYNAGCDPLNVDSILGNKLDYRVTYSPSILNPLDSGYIRIVCDPDSLGPILDTLVIANNDTANYIYLESFAYGEPAFSVDRRLIQETATSCDDTVRTFVRVRNTGGLHELEVSLDSAVFINPQDFLIGLVRSGTDTITEFPRIKNKLLAFGFRVIEVDASTSTSYINTRGDADLVIFPRLTSLSYAQQQALAFNTQFQMNRGALDVLLMANSNAFIDNLGLANTTGSAFLTGDTAVEIINKNHPITFGANKSRTYSPIQTRGVSYASTSPYTDIIHSLSTPMASVVNYVEFGQGKMGYFGYSYESMSSEVDLLFRNMICYLADLEKARWVGMDTSTYSIGIDDSLDIPIELYANSLTSETWIAYLPAKTNDPDASELYFKIAFDVQASSEMIPRVSCIDFDTTMISNQSVVKTWIRNVGCDTLKINGFYSTNPEFRAVSYQYAPSADSTFVTFRFTPSSIGAKSDTVYVYSRVDTLAFCVSGVGVAPPLAQVNPDSLHIVSTTCDTSASHLVSILNDGANNMNYRAWIGEVITDSVTHNYGSTQYSLSTSLLMNNLPTQIDSIRMTVVVNGDFFGPGKGYRIRLDNAFPQAWTDSMFQFLPAFTNDTMTFTFTDPVKLAQASADGSIVFNISNWYTTTAFEKHPTDFHHFVVEVYHSNQPTWLRTPFSGSGSGSIASNSQRDLYFGVDVSNLNSGVYHSTLQVQSNDPNTPRIEVPIEFEYRKLTLVNSTSSCVAFPPTPQGSTSTEVAWIKNGSCDTLQLNSVAFSTSEFSSNFITVSIPPGDSAQLSIDFQPAAANTFNGYMTMFTSQGTDTVCLFGDADFDPEADFQLAVTDTCKAFVQFSDLSLNQPTSWMWDFGDGRQSTVQNPLHQYTSSGVFYVTLTSTNAFGSSLMTDTVTVNSTVADFTMTVNGSPILNDTVFVNDQVDFVSTSTNGQVWYWDFGDGGSAMTKQASHTYQAVGTYSVELRISDFRSCDDSRTIQLVVLSDIGMPENRFGTIQLQPNPSSGNFTIDWSETNFDDVQIDVLDTRGAVLYHTSEKSQSRVDLDLTDLPDAMYLLRLTNSDGRVVHERLIKQ